MLHRTLAWMCLLGLAACAAPGGPASGAASPASAALGGTRWIGVADLPASTAPRLEFLDGGRVTGYTGCNMLSGTWRQEGGEVRFGTLVTTKRACLGPEGEVEKRVLAALGDRASARREGANLVLTGPGGARFEFRPA